MFFGANLGVFDFEQYYNTSKKYKMHLFGSILGKINFKIIDLVLVYSILIR